MLLGLAVGAINVPFALLFALVALGYSFLLTLASLALEEFSFHRYRRWSDLGWLVLASMAENLGYRQLTALWRIQGLWEQLRGQGYEWGAMTRIGFGADAASRPAGRR
jgi:hypothetical protein